MGPECSIRCPFSLYGYYCQSQCSCIYHHTRSCDVVTGDCDCLQGWAGSTCEISTALEGTNRTATGLPHLTDARVESSPSSTVDLSSLVLSAGPFVILAMVGAAIFHLRKRFWGDTIESQPLEEYVTYNPSTGSVVFSVNNGSSAGTNRRFDSPPSYENTISGSTLTLESIAEPSNRRPLPPPPDSNSIGTGSTKYEYVQCI